MQDVLIDGATAGTEGSEADVEVALDIEVAISMATNASAVVVYQAPNGSPFEDILNQMVTNTLVSQFSCSWYTPEGTAQPAADQIWMEMAAQGQSFFNASGDGDAWVGLIYFPGDSPYITQVGGTSLTTSGPGGAWVSETVWNAGNGGSGGGISTQYPIPSWQTNISMAANQGSTTMRNTPDVAMTAQNVYVRADGGDWNVGGTSCAAPLWAGFAALANQQAAASGKSPIGVINAAVDAIGTGSNYTSDFHDITTGNNTWSGSPTKFYAVPGYDLCTGWGTPAGQNLINALANPEPLIITPATGFTSTGGVGGPFIVTSGELSLTNAGTNTLTWTLSNTSVWLSVSSDEGILMPSNPAVTVTVSLNNAASNLVVGTYSATLWFTNLNDGVGQGRQFALNVIAPPAITSQPTNQSVIQGATAIFSAFATGGLPLSYQWQLNETNLSDGGNISGSMTTNLTISDVSAAAVGNYSLMVTNPAGVAVSSNASLTITPSPPIIITQPANESAIAGQTVTFNVGVIGTTPFSYQWSFDETNINNATNGSLTLTNVQASQAGTYAVLITNTLGSAVSSNATLNVYLVPVISSFSPGLGATGTVVNIYGLNFSPIISNNIVYFGAVQATVSSASATNLVVSVPPGATFAPITETVNGLTAYSDASFLPSFPGSGVFTNSSLGTQIILNSSNGPGGVVIADLDGDGKPDVAVTCGSDMIEIYRNISTNGTLSATSFAPPVVLPINSASLGNLVAADLTGDGKLDLISEDYDDNHVIVVKNLCTTGNITSNTFGAPVTFTVGNVPNSVAVLDLDGDGKPDIAVANRTDSTLGVLRNTSTPGTITTNSFAPMVAFATGANPQNVAIADIDGDGKPDLASADANYNGTTPSLSVLRNLSTPGNLAFATHVDFTGPEDPFPIAIGDIDGDGKPDVVIGSQPGGQVVSIYHNQSTPGSITTNSLATPVNFTAGAWVNWLALGDLNGDGKPDVVATLQSPSQMDVFINQSTPGIITNNSLASPQVFSSGDNPNGVAVGDLDGDGRPDIVFANDYGDTVSVYQNFTPYGGPPVITLEPTNEIAVASTMASLTVDAVGAPPLSYQWYFDSTNTLAGATNAVLLLSDVQATNAGDYSVIITNSLGSATSSVATLTVVFAPTITNEPVSITNLAGTTATFSVTAGGTPLLAYQWQKNGTNMTDGGNVSGSATALLTLTNVSSGDMANYAVVVTNTYGSATSSVATLTVLFGPIITSQPVSITNLAGTTATFSITVIGTLPLSYQWQKNGTNISDGGNISGSASAMLTLTDVSSNAAATYAVALTNAYGSAVSSNAILTVITPIVSTNVPVITSFSPGLGATGTVVNIYGLNFSPVALSNIIYFGAVQASVSSASTTNLVVSVPPGAMFAPITETVGGLTAYSDASFLPSFPGSGVFTNTSLGTQITLNVGGSGIADVAIADLDGDGKPDLAVINGNSTLEIYRNISTNGTLSVASFATPVVLPLASGAFGNVVAADLTGDGKLDLVCVDYQNNRVIVLKNLSTPGSITTNSFAPPVYFTVGNLPNNVAVEDLDGDGRPEIVVADRSDSALGILRNTSTPGTITTNSFVPMVAFATGANPQSVAIADMDGDGKPDLASADANYSGNTPSFSVLRNLSTPGNLAFATHVDFAGPEDPFPIAIGDIDGDGKPDVVIGSQPGGQEVSVYRNTSTPGSITTNSFAPPANFAAGAWVNSLALADMNGDGKLDVVAVCQDSSQMEVFINQSTPGIITNNSLAARLVFGSQTDPQGLSIGDLDGDGRPDIAFVNDGSSSVSIYQNFAPFGQSPTISVQPTNQTVAAGRNATFSITAGGTSPLAYQWLFNGTNAISGATNTTLTLTNAQSVNAGFYSVLVTNLYGSTNSSNALLVVTVDHFAWNTISSPRFLKTLFTVEILAQNATNGIFTNYSGIVFINSTNGLPVSPTASSDFVQGVWTGTVTVSQIATNLVLSASDASGHTGLANPINIVNLPQLATAPSGGTLYISWPTSPSGFVLETSTNVASTNWVRVSTTPLQFGGQNVIPITLPGTNACAFYRLLFTGP